MAKTVFRPAEIVHLGTKFMVEAPGGEVEEAVSEALDTDVAEAVDSAEAAVAESQVDSEESSDVEIDQADMSLGGEAVEGDDPDAGPSTSTEA